MDALRMNASSGSSISRAAATQSSLTPGSRAHSWRSGRSRPCPALAGDGGSRKRSSGKLRQVRFELGRRPIGQSRMQALAIMDLLDEAADHLACLVGVAVAAPVDLLLFECFHEALRLGIVVGIADAAHTRLDVVCCEQGGVFTACILHAAVGVMDEAARWG